MATFNDLENTSNSFTSSEYNNIIAYDDSNFSYDDVLLNYDGFLEIDWNNQLQTDNSFTDLTNV